jgi:hypothetical protein
MNKPIHRILLALALVTSLAAGCTDLESDVGRSRQPLTAAVTAPATADEWIQPSCVPNEADDDGTSDDGESCDGAATDDFCDIIPNDDPDLYCVSCTQSGSHCE